MKKFIINFKLGRTSYSAKVIVKKIEEKTIFSTTVINGKVEFAAQGVLLFMQFKNRRTLGLLTRDGKFKELKWRIEIEYSDKSEITHPEIFSKS